MAFTNSYLNFRIFHEKNDNIPSSFATGPVVEFRRSKGLCDWSVNEAGSFTGYMKLTRAPEMPRRVTCLLTVLLLCPQWED